MSMNSVIATRIRDLRAQRNDSLDDIAKLLKVNSTAVCKYETGYREPDCNTIIVLSQYFGVSTDYLLGATDIKDAPPLLGYIGTAARPSIGKFVPENIDLIRGDMTYEEMSNDMSIKMNNPLFKTIFDPGYLKRLAKGKLQATYPVTGLLASYTKVDHSFFYRKNTIEDLVNARKDYAAGATGR